MMISASSNTWMWPLAGGLAIAWLLAAVPGAEAQIPESCEQAGAAAEQAYGLPVGLLQAIGRVESGRWDKSARKIVVWPWSIDVDGAAHWYDNAESALQDLRAQSADGRHSIDVGCFQINLGWHPHAFPSLDQAFDPIANANYAASFLRSLSLRLGSWTAAVAAYHSANPDLGIPYRDRVMATWSTGSVASPVPVPAWQAEAERFGIRIWTPANAAPAAESRSEPHESALPRVITPGR
jgi:soluble lytic murein transglycosylase-like protein